MDSRTGKKISLARLLDPSTGHGVIIAASHGVLTGPPPGLVTIEEMTATFAQLSGANGIMVAPGMVSRVEDCFLGRSRPSLVVHVDWKSFGRPILTPGTDGRREGHVTAIASIDEVAAAGADAVMTYLYVGQDDTELERLEIERNARLAADCARLGIVLIVEPRAARDATDPTQVEDEGLLAFYCRLAVEIGADIVKCIWPGSVEKFAKVTASTPAPVLLAGGPAYQDAAATFQLAAGAMTAGGSGFMFGRRVYRAEHPAAVLAGLRAILDEGATAEGALARYTQVVSDGPAS
ncbi:MAG: hypothetical protein KJ041_08810 [Gammaproteobacteria bacterium]|nr:hypothetical protein [Gammaproteobacteria bacterium]